MRNAEFLRAVGTGRIDEVEAMLASDASLVNAIGPHPFWGGRPQALHVAIEGGRREIFQLLLENGADVNGSNDEYDHWSPLMLAIHRGHDDIREELLRRGARVGLLEALMMADDARVDELLRANGLPEVAPNGGSVFAFARTPHAIDALLALGAKADIDAMSRLGPRGASLVRHMIARGIPAAARDYARLGDLETLANDPSAVRDESVMMGAVDFGHHALVRWLIERGANVNARSDAASRHTALHSAAWNGDLQMVELLLESGADTSARDDEYDATPLAWAETSIEVSNNPKCAAVVAYLSDGSSARR